MGKVQDTPFQMSPADFAMFAMQIGCYLRDMPYLMRYAGEPRDGGGKEGMLSAWKKEHITGQSPGGEHNVR